MSCDPHAVAALFQKSGIFKRTQFGYVLLRFVVDMAQAEPALAAETPSEVVHQRPVETPAEVDVCADRAVDRNEVARDVRNRLRVVDLLAFQYVVDAMRFP